MALTEADFGELTAIRRRLSAFAFELTILNLQRALAKAYNPGQPRTPPGHGRESGRWTPVDEDARDAGESEQARPRRAELAFLPPYLIETYNMGPRTICTYQGWPESNRFTIFIPRGGCEPYYLPGYGPI